MFQAIKNYVEGCLLGYEMEDFIISYKVDGIPEKFHVPIFASQLPHFVQKSMKESGQSFAYQEIEKINKFKYKKVSGWLTTQEDQRKKDNVKTIHSVLVR
jgi:hypothetical protein